MRFFIALALTIVSSKGVQAACPLDDVLKLCIASSGNLSALDEGVDNGAWTVKINSSPAGPTSQPATGSRVYTMPSGLQFLITYQDYKNFLSSNCEFDFVTAYTTHGAEGMSCSANEVTAFEAALSQSTAGVVTKEPKKSGTAYLIEGPSMWMTVILTKNNVWVETSVLKKK